jgi:hypothetical protein
VNSAFCELADAAQDFLDALAAYNAGRTAAERLAQGQRYRDAYRRLVAALEGARDELALQQTLWRAQAATQPEPRLPDQRGVAEL